MTKELLFSHLNMLWKAAAGAALAAAAGYVSGVDLGVWNPLAVVAVQFAVHLAAKYGIGSEPKAPSVFW